MNTSDQLIDMIESLHYVVCRNLSIQEGDVIWYHLVEHYYYYNYYGEA